MKLIVALKISAEILVSSLILGTGAQASPITSWNVKVTTAFNDATFGSGIGCPVTTSTQISWGECPAGPPAFDARSGIEITNSTIDTLILTDGPSVGTGAIFTHYNFSIYSFYQSLLTAKADLTLEISSTQPATATASEHVLLPFEIFFHETPDDAACSVASVVPCPDIFVLLGSLNREFEFDDDTYYLSFFPTTDVLASLPQAACEEAGAAYPCVGFTTEEQAVNEVSFNMTITTKPLVFFPIPEPGTLLLFLLAVGALLGPGRRPAMR